MKGDLIIKEQRTTAVNIFLRTTITVITTDPEELVWHGGMNLLGKVDIWDNLMRIRNHEVAAELLEISLGTTTGA
jgi:hypothetical protein